MTLEQQQLVRYAEAIGWFRARRGSAFPRWNFPDFGGGIRVWRYPDTNGKIWNPLTDANDALELAEKMNVLFERSPDYNYWAQIDGEGARADTLPAAICAAVDAGLEAK